jgi:hypothetical protein
MDTLMLFKVIKFASSQTFYQTGQNILDYIYISNEISFKLFIAQNYEI